ncbi:MAG: hypothetical protein ACQEQ4_09050 [Fibrobacterota bacterium]
MRLMGAVSGGVIPTKDYFFHALYNSVATTIYREMMLTESYDTPICPPDVQNERGRALPEGSEDEE